MHRNHKDLLPCFRHPEYYQMIDDPIDMNTIEKRIVTGAYTTIQEFHADFMRLFKNVEV